VGLQTARALGDKRQEADALLAVGRLAESGCLYEEARDSFIAAVELFAELGDHARRNDAILALEQLAHTVGDRRARMAYDGAAAVLEPRSQRAGRALGSLFGGRARMNVLELLAALALLLVPLVAPRSVVGGVAMALSAWISTGVTRVVLIRVSKRLRTPGLLVMLPFAGLTLLFFFAAYAIGRPAAGAAVVLLLAALRCGRAGAVHMTPVRRVATWIGLGSTVLAIIAAIVSSVWIGHVLVATMIVFVAAFGWGARPASIAERVAQTGWFVVRFFVPIGIVAAFANYRHVAFGPWGAWAGPAVAVGLVLVALSLIVTSVRDKLGAFVLLAGSVLLALWTVGVVPWTVAAAVIGVAYVIFVVRPAVLPDPPLIEIPVVV
jgi:hypothetical protein